MGMIEMVLATDMKLHFDILGRFRLIEKKVADLSAGQNHDSQTTSSAATKLEPEDLSLHAGRTQVCGYWARLLQLSSSLEVGTEAGAGILRPGRQGRRVGCWEQVTSHG